MHDAACDEGDTDGDEDGHEDLGGAGEEVGEMEMGGGRACASVCVCERESERE